MRLAANFVTGQSTALYQSVTRQKTSFDLSICERLVCYSVHTWFFENWLASFQMSGRVMTLGVVLLIFGMAVSMWKQVRKNITSWPDFVKISKASLSWKDFGFCDWWTKLYPHFVIFYFDTHGKIHSSKWAQFCTDIRPGLQEPKCVQCAN